MASFRSLWRTCALIASLSALAGPVAAAEFTPAQKTEMGQVIHDYLMANPEVLRDAIGELQNREKSAENQAQSKITGDLSGPLYSPAYGTVIGNPNGKVTLVEFFDYNCGYCKHALGDLAALMKSNPDMRVILKDFPILSPASVEAAQVAVAARNQFKGDKFWSFTRNFSARAARWDARKRSLSRKTWAPTWTACSATPTSRKSARVSPRATASPRIWRSTAHPLTWWDKKSSSARSASMNSSQARQCSQMR